MKRLAWITVGIIGGAVSGAALGYLDVLFLSLCVSFEQPHDYLSIGQLFVRYVPSAINAANGCIFGALAALMWTRQAPEKTVAADLLPWAVSGAFSGALLGYLDIFVMSQFLNLLNSDTVAAWRENRSYVPMINAGGGLLIGLVLGSTRRRRSSPRRGWRGAKMDREDRDMIGR